MEDTSDATDRRGSRSSQRTWQAVPGTAGEAGLPLRAIPG